MHVTARTSDGVTKDYTICFYAARNYNYKYITINGICSVNDKAAINLGVSYNSNDTSLVFRWQIYDLRHWQLVYIEQTGLEATGYPGIRILVITGYM